MKFAYFSEIYIHKPSEGLY